ncbi:YcxB family protein [Gracilibacillus massiliensis]|uniref:YcxB family protein n=1 Tax=Gracilibacillus massiliensis TaxID=1564956 RepID=UPI00071D657D|nr:YcxB family protein [Gracilibacillus massiliensis]
MATENVIVNGIRTLDDFKKFHTYHFEKIKRNYVLFTTILTMLLYFIVIQMIFSYVFDFNNVWLLSFVVALILSLLTAAASIFFMKVAVNYRSVSEYKSDPTLQYEIIYHFSKDVIKQEKGRSIEYFKWNEIFSVNEHQDMYLLYVSKYKASIVAKRFFETRDEEELFKLLVSNNIPASKVNWI